MGDLEALEYRERLAERLGAEWVERFDSIRQYLVFGNHYHRGIADCWRTVTRMALAKDRQWECDYWLGHLGWLIESAEKSRAHRPACQC